MTAPADRRLTDREAEAICEPVDNAPPLSAEQIAGIETPNLRALFPNLDENTHRLAQELVDRAPALSREQLDSIRAVITGGGDRG